MTLSVECLYLDCPLSTPFDVEVNAGARNYHSKGKFHCSPDSELFNVSSESNASADTICLNDATWRDCQYVDCWKGT